MAIYESGNRNNALKQVEEFLRDEQEESVIPQNFSASNSMGRRVE